MAINYAAKYSKKVDERFTRASQALEGVAGGYEFTGQQTVKVYSIPTVSMSDYTRSGANRYGTPSELQDNIQSMTLTKDRSFVFTIDRGNKIQQEMVKDAGKALSRQLSEVVIPEFDTHVFGAMANGAHTNGFYSTTVITKSNAYEQVLEGQEKLGDANVPDKGRVVFCSYAFANKLMMDSAFVKQASTSQEMVIKGIIGMVDGTKVVRVPSSRLPSDTSFIIVHPSAMVAPKQLWDYRIHENPPGISGWLVEGRFIYDAFVLSQKADALYLGLGSGRLGSVGVTSVEGATSGKTVITATGAPFDTTYVYKTGTSETAVSYGDDVSSGWTALPADGIITPTASHTLIQVVSKDLAGKARAKGSATLVIKA